MNNFKEGDVVLCIKSLKSHSGRYIIEGRYYRVERSDGPFLEVMDDKGQPSGVWYASRFAPEGLSMENE